MPKGGYQAMKAFFGLTSNELDVMEMFWSKKDSMSFGEILEYMSTVFKKDWKSQTLNTYLSNLRKAGLVQIDRTNYHYQYSAACTKEEYIHRWTQKLVEDTYGNSISSLVAAFIGDGELSPEEAERIQKLI